MLNHHHQQQQHPLSGAVPAVSTTPMQSHQYHNQQPQQLTSSYAYAPHQHPHAHHQQQQPTTTMSSDSLRPTLDATSYYPPPHLQSYAPQQTAHGYYDPLAASASLHYALAPTLSHKRKSPGAASATSTASASASPSFAYAHDKLCDVCYHPDPVLFSAACGHLFHSRCVHVWPLDTCPVCDVAMPHVSILRIDMNAQIDTRSGKWTRPEEKFIDCILAEFDRSSLPLANGTPVRLVLAKLLNCSTMRLSKKFQKNALGKRTFRISKPTKGECALVFDRSDHVARQKELSRLEAIFRHELVEQFRRENNTDDGAYAETHDLRHAVKQFWVACFVKLAVVIGQPVAGLDVSDSKKKKHALVLIRNGQYDDLLGWNESPANTPTVAPLPWHTTSNSSGLSGAAAGSVYSTQQLQQSQQQQHMHMQPVKKMRTPESMARSSMHDSDGAHFDAQLHQQTQPSIAVATAYAYGKTSPRGFSPVAATDQHPQPQSHYYAQQPTSGFARGAATTPSGGYATYAVKTEKSEPLHYSQLGPLPAAAASLSGSNNSGAYRTNTQPPPQTGGASCGNYESSSESFGASHQHATHQQSSHQQSPQHATQQHTTHQQQAPAGYHWDELLEAIPEPNQQAVDPTLQAWTNLHIM